MLVKGDKERAFPGGVIFKEEAEKILLAKEEAQKALLEKEEAEKAGIYNEARTYAPLTFTL